MKIKGTAIFVENVSKTAKYYKGVFGVDPEHQEENSVAFMIDGFRFFIHKKMDFDPEMPPNEDHIEIETNDLDKSIEKLTHEGYEILLNPKEYYWGKSAYLRDPEGRMVELTESS